MSSKKFILGRKGQQNEDMKFGDQSRPDPHVQQYLKTGATPFMKVDLPNPPEGEGYSNFHEFLASDEYSNALKNLEKFTGKRNIGTGVGGEYGAMSMSASRILFELKSAESNKEEQLKKLCEKIIINLFPSIVKRDRDNKPILDENGKPQLRIQFDLKFTQLGSTTPPSLKKKELEDREEQIAHELNDGDLKLERARRRLENALTQGLAVDSVYVFNNFKNIVTKLLGVDNIVEKYSYFVSVMMLGYWQFPESSLAQAGEEGSKAAGKTRVDTKTNPPTIHAEGIIFPFLIHEAIKGVQEYFSIPKRRTDFKDDDDRAEYEKRLENYETAKGLEDELLHEIWDIRLGPAIWRKFIKKFPKYLEDQKRKRFFEKILQSYIYVTILNLKTKEFLLFFKEIMDESEIGNRLMGAMFYDITGKLKGEQVSTSTSFFIQAMDEYMKSKEEEKVQDEIDDFLSGLGISYSDDEE